MSDLTLKQVQGDNSATCGVPAGARIEHLRQENKLAVRYGQQVITEFDLAEGTVYLMNSAGKTIDKYESNGAKPKQLEPDDYANADDYIFTLHGVRYINFNCKTYRVPEQNPHFILEALDKSNVIIGRVQVNKWGMLKRVQPLKDLFGADNVEQIQKIRVIGNVKFEPQDFVLGTGVNFQNGTIVPHEHKLKEFGATFHLVPDVHLIKNNKVYTANANGDMLYHGLLVAEGK